MSRKSTLLAVAAAASLGAIALSSSDALALRASGSGLRAAIGPVHVGPALRSGGARLSPPKLVKLPPPIVYPPHHWHWHWAWHHRYFIPPVVVGGAVAATYAVAAPATALATNHCTCLTKQYTPEGAVVFQDICTNEMAMNPPAGDASQPPQQQGFLQPQPQGYLQPQTPAQ